MKRNDSRKIKREIENWKKREKKIGLIIIDPFLNKYIYIYIFQYGIYYKFSHDSKCEENYIETRLIT